MKDKLCESSTTAEAQEQLVPPTNGKPWKLTIAGDIARNDAENASRYLGRIIWKRWSGYHRRSRVETNAMSGEKPSRLSGNEAAPLCSIPKTGIGRNAEYGGGRTRGLRNLLRSPYW